MEEYLLLKGSLYIVHYFPSDRAPLIEGSSDDSLFFLLLYSTPPSCISADSITSPSFRRMQSHVC
mgnify:CR=1 FL=1